LHQKHIALERLIDKTILLNPLQLMSKGYGVVYKDNEIITSIEQVTINDTIVVEIKDGSITSTIIKTEKRKDHGKEII
jgi:exodeoxyribonuclease VII large subunit